MKLQELAEGSSDNLRWYDAEFIMDETGEEVDEPVMIAVDSLGILDREDAYGYDHKEMAAFNRRVTNLSKQGYVIGLSFGDDSMWCCLLDKIKRQ